MALIKEISWKGILCNYWKVMSSEPRYDHAESGSDGLVSVKVAVALYKNKVARNENVDNHLATKCFVFPDKRKVGVDADNKPIYIIHMPAKEDRHKIYKALKELPEFEDATDD